MALNKKRSIFLTSEDYWAIWLGSFFLLAGIVVYLVVGRAEFGDKITQAEQIVSQESKSKNSISWYKANEQLEKLTGSNTSLGKEIKKLFSRPKSWKYNPVDAFYKPTVEPDESAKSKIVELERKLADLEAKAAMKESEQTVDVDTWLATKAELEKLAKETSQKGHSAIPGLVMLGVVLAMIFGVGAYFMGFKYFKFTVAFFGVFALAVISYFLAAQVDMKNLGVSYAVWAILIGLIISNTIGSPSWMKPAIQTEYYIKTGLVLLGAEILLSKIMAIGLPGIFVSWVVTPVVLVLTFWFGQKVLKIGSKTLNITISADMSVCGVSAAIATAAACNAKKEELTLAVGLSMVFTSIMMIVMPAFINAVGMPEVLGGAWIGGTIDATGAVVAAGAFLGDSALNVAATIKMIQNVLIGLIAFGVAFYWATKVEQTGNVRVGASEIWRRFPKFILGFLGASIIFSLLYYFTHPQFSYAFIDHGIIRGFAKDLRGWLFCLAFVSIGLSVNFKELKHQFSGGKPLILYVCGQSFNLMFTLLMAYLMFYIVFPEITELIK